MVVLYVHLNLDYHTFIFKKTHKKEALLHYVMYVNMAYAADTA